MEPSTLSMISAIGGLAGAVGAGLAALAAFRSAGVAKTAVDQAAKSEERRIFDDTVRTAQRVVAEHGRVVELAGRLKIEYQTLFTLAGRTGSSRLDMHLGLIADKEAEIAPYEQRATQWLSTLTGQIDDPQETEVEKLYEFSGYLAQLEAVKDGFREDYGYVERQSQTYRARALNRAP